MESDSSQTQISLSEIREEIDAIDAGLLQLLIRRFGMIDLVRKAKAGDGELAASPLRPAREAQILRSLFDKAGKRLPRQLIYRLWRTIVCEACLRQAPVTLHVQSKILSQQPLRLMVEEHFTGFPIQDHRTASALFASMASSPADAAVVLPDKFDIRQFLKHAGDQAHISASLPFMTDAERPDLLVVTQSPPERTGDDETLVLTSGGLPRDFVPTPLWTAQTRDGRLLSSLPGFLIEEEGPLVGLKRNSGLNLKVLGRYPSPLAAGE